MNDGPKISFSMLPGSPDERDKRDKRATVKVALSTGRGHPAVKAPKRQISDAERERLAKLWSEFEARRREMEEKEKELTENWPDDLTYPGGRKMPMSTTDAIDWGRQPSIPAEKIDWSAQGEPLRVRLTWGAMIMGLTILVSVLGSGAYFYWSVQSHVSSKRLHLTDDGVGWGAAAKFETRDQAQKARDQLGSEVRRDINSSTATLRHEQQKATEAILSEVRKIRRLR